MYLLRPSNNHNITKKIVKVQNKEKIAWEEKRNCKQICLSLLKIDMKQRMEMDRMKNKNLKIVIDMSRVMFPIFHLFLILIIELYL